MQYDEPTDLAGALARLARRMAAPGAAAALSLAVAIVRGDETRTAARLT
jgi:hypothetical protein